MANRRSPVVMLGEEELSEVRELIDTRDRLITKIKAIMEVDDPLVTTQRLQGVIESLRRVESELGELGVPVEPYDC